MKMKAGSKVPGTCLTVKRGTLRIFFFKEIRRINAESLH